MTVDELNALLRRGAEKIQRSRSKKVRRARRKKKKGD
jgi:hypothetical protein